MNVFLIVLLVIIGLIVIVCIAAALRPNEYVIERNIVINKPGQEVFNYVRLLKNQEHYNKWVMTDPKAYKQLQGIDGTPGAVYAWSSENKQVGKGEQEIKSIAEGKSIDQEIRFEKPVASTSYVHIITEPITTNSTRVKFVFRGLLNYPMKLIHMIFNLQKMLAKDVETSLHNLQTVLESK